MHPKDKDDVDLLFKKMRKNLNTFPCPFWGPILTAKVVLCYAGPGSTEHKIYGSDRKNARDPNWVKERVRSFDGKTPINFSLLHPTARAWFSGRIGSILGVSKEVAEEYGGEVAVVDLTAYRGVNTAWEEVAFLPSTQVMRSWAKEVLFVDAIREKRVVLVMRANKWWGVPSGPWKRGNLFAPACTRSGYPILNCKFAAAAKKAAREVLKIKR